MRILLTALVASLLIAGCKSNKDESSGPISRIGSDDAADINSKRNPFEASDDPPINARTRLAAGQLAEGQGALPQAIAQYQEAVKIEPKNEVAWFRLGVLYAKTKQYPKAIEAWENYIEVTGGEAVAYSNLAFCHEVSGDRETAEKAYKHGIGVDPNNIACRVNYGLMLARMGREPESLEQLQAVLPPAAAHYNLGSIYEIQGKKDQARAEYRKALQLDPQLLDAQTRLAQMK